VNEPIQEKAPKPPGLLPKNVQSWLLISLALLMVVIMWATGGKKPQPAIKTAATTVPAQAPPEVNQTRINDLQNRIEELQRQELVAQNALAQQGRLLGAMPQGSQPGQQPSASGNQPPERTEDAIQSEQKRRQYLSLFASNVALSYRKSPAAAHPATQEEPGSNHTMETPLPESPDTTQLAQLLKEMHPLAPLPTAAPPTAPSISAPAQNVSPERNSDRKEEAPRPAAAPSGTHNVAAGQTYILFEGTILETVLINRLDGSFSGPVECLLTNDVFSHDRQHLLIPAGTKVLGEAKKVEALGQTRLAVVFHRLIMPDGYSVSLDQFKGLDQIGDTGLRDKVNNHYLRLFGVSLAIGALGAVAEAGTGSALTASGTDMMRQGFASSTAQSASQILDRFLNVMPTVTIREGHRVKVYLSGDLALPDYKNHTMPSDF
jgi:type IV secretory pathway VirB10-like protein